MVALRSDIDARDAQVEVGDLAPVVADRVQLAQAFQNLIGNAIKYVPDDRRPQVRITSRREGSMERFSVADNGVGVQPEEAAGLFEMFGRGTHDTPYEGFRHRAGRLREDRSPPRRPSRGRRGP